MKRSTTTFSIISTAACVSTLVWASVYGDAAKADPSKAGSTTLETRSSPPDLTPYTRPPFPEDLSPREKSPMGADTQVINPEGWHGKRLFMVDVVVNNTDPNLTNTDRENDGETSIAVNPRDPKEIVISAFSGFWGANAPIYHSLDGGLTWTKEFSVPNPTGWPTAPDVCPCDWTWDYGRNNELSGVILDNSPTVPPSAANPNPLDVVTGTTTDPTRAASFNYFDPPGVPVQAQQTNINVPTSLGNADQPWLLVNPDPKTKGQDNVYVAWADFSNTDGVDGVDMRVAVSYGLAPPNFTQDQQVGNSLSNVAPGINPGLRLAKDKQRGTIWALWGRNPAAGAGDSKNIDYMLNQSRDGGSTWSLNGSPLGIVIANADSTQPTPKFGTVNALLGNVDHAAVDPKTGNLYYVYGNRDANTSNNRLAIRQISSDAAGNATIGGEHFVTGQVQAAIPQVAVTDNGTIGVFYYTFDGLSATNFPIFTAHFAVSRNQGVTFADRSLLTFMSSAKDDGDPSQRVLGDYMQTKTLGNCFFGSFTANGMPFGRPVSNHDPIFFKTCS